MASVIEALRSSASFSSSTPSADMKHVASASLLTMLPMVVALPTATRDHLSIDPPIFDARACIDQTYTHTSACRPTQLLSVFADAQHRRASARVPHSSRHIILVLEQAKLRWLVPELLQLSQLRQQKLLVP